jgi:hypothetical protein
VWKRPDFGEFAQWRVVGEASTLKEGEKLEEEINRNDCDCSTAVLPEDARPNGYADERAAIRRG